MSQVQVTIVFDSVHEAEQFFAKRGGAAATEITQDPDVAMRTVAKAVVNTVKGADKPDTKPAETKKPEPAGDATAPVERSAVSALAVKLAVKDKAKAVEILAEHGVKAVKELADDDLAAVHAKLTAALDG